MDGFLPGGMPKNKALAPTEQGDFTAVENLGYQGSLGGDQQKQRQANAARPEVTAGTPDLLRSPMPSTIQALNEHPEYQQLALKQYNYARKYGGVSQPPEMTDPREIAEWATKNYAWLRWSDVKKMTDFHKLSNMPMEVLEAWNEGRKMWDNTDGSTDQALRAGIGVLTSPLTYMGIGVVKGAVQGVLGKQIFMHLAKTAEKAGAARVAGTTANRLASAAAIPATGAAWSAADAAYDEKFASKAEGREFNSEGAVTEAAAMGALAAPAMIAGGYAGYKGVQLGLKAGQQAVKNTVRLYRGSKLGALKTESGKAGVWTDSQEAAAQFAGDSGSVHVVNAYPQRPMIFNQADYSVEELLQKLNIPQQRAGVLLEAYGQDGRIPVKEVVDAFEDELRDMGVDMAIIREPVEGMESIYGLDTGSLSKGEIQSYKVLNPDILWEPKGFEPMSVPRQEAGMVGTYYHGSGAKHEGFDEAFLRTGEGAAVYGEGFYVAQRKGTAEWYQKKLGVGRVKFDGKEVENRGYGSVELQRYAERIGRGEEDPEVLARGMMVKMGRGRAVSNPQQIAQYAVEAINMRVGELKAELNHLGQTLHFVSKQVHQGNGKDMPGWGGSGGSSMTRWTKYGQVMSYEDALPVLREAHETISAKLHGWTEAQNKLLEDDGSFINKFEFSSGGHLYRTEVIPEEHEFLDWDKPLSEQSDTVKQALETFGYTAEKDMAGIRADMKAALNLLNSKPMEELLPTFVLYRLGQVKKVVDGKVEPVERRVAEQADSLAAELHDVAIKLDNDGWPGVAAIVRDARAQFRQISDDLKTGHRDSTGADIYNELRAMHKDNIRDVLHKAGIKGTKYLDGGSRHAGKGTHNLVVFKSQDIKIRQRDHEMFDGYDVTEAKDFLRERGIDLDSYNYKELQDYVDLAKYYGWDGKQAGKVASAPRKQRGAVGSKKKVSYERSNSQRTQRKNTEAAYKGAGAKFADGDLVIDFGAGLGHGTQYLGKGAVAHEPFAKDWEPDFRNPGELLDEYKGKADGVVNNLVLNVIESPVERAEVVRNIGDLLKPGGRAYIATRSASDVNGAKNKIAHKDGWLVGAGDNKTFQKGFTQKELEEYVQDTLGSEYIVTRSDHAPGGNPQVEVTRKESGTWALPNNRISQMQPTGKNPVLDPLLEEGVVGLDAIEAAGLLSKNMKAVRQYPVFMPDASHRSDKDAAEYYIGMMKDNLVWLWNQIPPEIRNESRKWYEGANAITRTIAKRYGIDDHVMAGINAVLSPKTDWDQNASMGERLVDILSSKANTKTTGAMLERAKEIYRKPEQLAAWNAVKDKTLAEIDHPVLKSYWIRAYDEAHNDRGFRVVDPNGHWGDWARTGKGDKKVFSWQSHQRMGYAIEMFEKQDMATISRLLGNKHKIRNFYNNIIDPADNQAVTIDTHAVAAAHLMPYGLKDTAVNHNFGGSPTGVPGAGNNKNAGVSGTYGLGAEAYRRAAEELGVLPRELQSVVWEGVRGLFPAAQKKGLSDKVAKVWDNYRHKRITLDDARNQIKEVSGGINEPAWWGSGNGGAGETFHSSYGLELPQPGGVRGDQSGRIGSRGSSRDTGLRPEATEGISPYPVLGATAAVGGAGLAFIPYSRENQE